MSKNLFFATFIRGLTEMRLLNPSTRWLIFFLVLAIGCNPGTKPVTVNTGEEDASSEQGSRSNKKFPAVKRNVKAIEGNWVIVVTANRSDNYRWIIKFTRGDDGKISADLIDTSRDKEEQNKPKIISTDVEGDSVRFVCKNEFTQFDFVGTFQTGFIRGTVKSSPMDVFVARLLPTEETSLQNYEANGLPPASDVFEKMMKDKELRPEDMVAKAVEHGTSPLVQDIFGAMIAGYQQANFDEASLKSMIESYLTTARIWGQRWEARCEIKIAYGLLNGRQYVRTALEHLDTAEKLLGDEREAFTESLKAARESASVYIRIEELTSASSSEDVKTTAAAELTEVVKKQRYNSEILMALANRAEQQGQDDVAIGLLAEISALPLLELTVLKARVGQPPDTPAPSEAFKNLWAKKYGSDEGSAAFVDDVYKKEIARLIAEIQANAPPVPTAEDGNKTVLVELFTGIGCPPCVGADLGLAALGKSVPNNKAIILRFHQHIPLPDGLVNQDSEERGTYYETGSTPTVTIDGGVIDSRFYAGPIPMANNAYMVFRKVIDPRLTLKTGVAIKLSAEVTDGQLKVSAEVTGIPEEVLPSCRLRMAIVENEVRTIVPMGSNGIRNHELLVREMPGGAKGIPPRKGELKYSVTTPVSEIQQRVEDYIKRYEVGRRFEFPVEMKPPIKGPLSLVAWVQNDKPDKEANSRPVLQAAIVPVTGDTGFGGATDPVAQVTGNSDKPATSSEPAPVEGPTPPALPE